VITIIITLLALGGYVVHFAQTIPGMIVIGFIVVWIVFVRVRRTLRRRRLAQRKKAAATSI
jgi:hypothetical protein